MSSADTEIDYDPNVNLRDTNRRYFVEVDDTVNGHDHYLRLRSFRRAEFANNRFLPNSIADAISPNLSRPGYNVGSNHGLSLSTSGVFLNKVTTGYKQTFGQALTETVYDADHTITVQTGDYTLEAKNGSISYTTDNGIISLRASDSMYFKAPVMAKASDSRNSKTSEQDKTSVVVGYQYTSVTGTYVKTQFTAFSMSINLAGMIVLKLSGELKASGTLALKVGAKSLAFGVVAIGANLISLKLTPIDGKQVILYNKITTFQIYQELFKDENKALKNAQTFGGADMEMLTAIYEKKALTAGLYGLMHAKM